MYLTDTWSNVKLEKRLQTLLQSHDKEMAEDLVRAVINGSTDIEVLEEGDHIRVIHEQFSGHHPTGRDFYEQPVVKYWGTYRFTGTEDAFSLELRATNPIAIREGNALLASLAESPTADPPSHTLSSSTSRGGQHHDAQRRTT